MAEQINKDATLMAARPILALDSAALTVTAVLSTQAIDSSGDRVYADGFDYSDHDRNPVGLFHHRRDLPVCQWRDPATHLYSIRPEQHVPSFGGVTVPGVVGKAWFAAGVRDSYETYALIAEGILRGVSIGFLSLDQRRRTDDEAPDRPKGFDIFKLLLKEVSFEPVQDNGDALVLFVEKCVSSVQIKDSLRPYFPALKAWANGAAALVPAPSQQAAQPAATAPVEAKAMADVKTKDADSERLPGDDDAMGPLSGSHYKMLHEAHAAAEELHDSTDMDGEARQKRCKSIMKACKACKEAMMPGGKKPDDADGGEGEREEESLEKQLLDLTEELFTIDKQIHAALSDK